MLLPHCPASLDDARKYIRRGLGQVWTGPREDFFWRLLLCVVVPPPPLGFPMKAPGAAGKIFGIEFGVFFFSYRSNKWNPPSLAEVA